jgi:protein-tyrosine phosphatase
LCSFLPSSLHQFGFFPLTQLVLNIFPLAPLQHSFHFISHSLHTTLGNMNAASAETELKHRRITTIINCAQTAELADKFDSKSFNYVRLGMVEHPHPLNFNASKIFERGVAEITDALTKGGSVLVHCIGGMCRSPSIVVAFLIKEKKMAPSQAYKFVRELRPIVDINKIYLAQLDSWASQHLQRN